jgi:hypothetical protein
MRRFLGWCLGLSAALLSVGVFAQAELAPDKPLPNAELRRALAKKYAATFAQLDRQIPQLSPRQETWLKGEYHEQIAAAGNRYTQRALAAMNSPEYQIYVAKPKTGEIAAVMSRIASGTQNKAAEIALWTTAAYMLIDYEYWQAVGSLVDRKTIQPKIGHVDSYYHQNYALQAQGILSKIVVPYIEGRLP